jgi:hypothetical protein
MRRLGILIFALFLFSCKSSIPKDVLPPKKMQAVLWDVMQADELAEYYSAQDSTFRNLSKRVDYYQKVFSIHKIKKEDFTKSLSYYENHPQKLKPILDSIQSFGTRQKSVDSLKTIVKPAVIDSATKKPLIPFKKHR